MLLRPTLLLDFARSRQVGLGTFARAGAGTRTNRLRAFDASVAAGVPRIQYDRVTGACRGLRMEEADTNLLTRSNDFSHADWTVKTTVSLATGVADPWGGTGATTVTATGAGAALGQVATVTSGVALTGGIWIRRRTGTGDLYLFVGDNTGILITSSVGLDWSYVPRTATPTSTTGRFYVFISTLGDAVDIYESKLRAGDMPLSEVLTTASQVTRPAESLTLTGSAFTTAVSQTAGTFVAELWLPSLGSGLYRVASMNDGSTDNRITAAITSSTFAMYRNTAAAGLITDPFTANAPIVGRNRVAWRYASGNVAICANGGAVAASTSHTIASGVNRLDVGHQLGAGQVNGEIGALSYYPAAASDAELQALTIL